MAYNVKQEFGSTTAMTITINSLANSATAGRESTAIDNGTNKFLDAIVYVTVNVGAGTIANEKCAYIYAYGSEDGSNYSGNCTGVDAAYTFRDPTDLKLVCVIPIPTASTTYKVVFSVAAAFGGILPRLWGIVVKNYCGLALGSSNNAASYSGIYATVA